MTEPKALDTKMYVRIYTVQDISNHINTTSSTSTQPLNPRRKGVLQAKREAFFKKMCFQIFLEKGERWRAADLLKLTVNRYNVRPCSAGFSQHKLHIHIR